MSLFGQWHFCLLRPGSRVRNCTQARTAGHREGCGGRCTSRRYREGPCAAYLRGESGAEARSNGGYTSTKGDTDRYGSPDQTLRRLPFDSNDKLVMADTAPANSTASGGHRPARQSAAPTRRLAAAPNAGEHSNDGVWRRTWRDRPRCGFVVQRERIGQHRFWHFR